jgi:protoporphyrin/coproporphyrin ferrochelatase
LKGLLLVNLGTPDAPQTREVRRYLREFLSDPYVIDLHPVARWALLNLIILPRRPAKSAEAYRKIWDEVRGSPLLFHSFDLVSQVARALEGQFQVQLAMRYGKPSLESGLAALFDKGVDELHVLPLYPQYATSSTESTVDRVRSLLSARWPEALANTRFVPEFYAHPAFLDAFAQVARPALEQARADHVLFSFHGLPVRHIEKQDATGAHCLRSASCCDSIVDANRRCYRAQSYFTARALAQRLSLPAERFSVGFQSRLTSRWIEPFSDALLDALPRQGVKRLAVICPAFVADCLETLEEIGIRARDQFRAAGGEELFLVPSLNAHPAWVSAVERIVRGP